MSIFPEGGGTVGTACVVVKGLKGELRTDRGAGVSKNWYESGEETADGEKAAGEEEAQKVNTKCKGVNFQFQFIFIQFCNKFLFLNGFSYFVIILE